MNQSESDMRQLVALNIIHYRRLQGLSRIDLGLLTSINPGTITHIERARRPISVYKLFRICEALDCTYTQILPPQLHL